MPEMMPALLGRRRLPTQDASKVLVLAELWNKASGALATWATKAKECVDFVEGRQYKAETLRAMEMQGRPALTLNKIAPLARLVMGYHRNNRTDTRFLPASTGWSDEATAEAISKVIKEVNENSSMPYVDAEVFMDGLLTGRGFFDTRLDFVDNDLGEAVTKAVDPFTVYPDPDAEGYDLNDGGFICVSRRLGMDEIEFHYGPEAAEFSRPFLRGQVPMGPVTTMSSADGEITPVRAFGSRDSSDRSEWWDSIYNYLGYDFVDPYRKTFRLLDFQYKVTDMARVFIDLETGDRKVIPEDWDDERIKKTLYLAQERNDPVVVDIRPVRRVRWTTLVGDVMLYDAWSYYDKFSIDGFFPYFRRGQTRGMIEDLIDPQKEVNRRRNAELEIVTKTANGGWIYHQDSLDKENERNLKQFGARPGVLVKYKGDVANPPKQIEAGPSAARHERLEEKARDDIREIAGINESALGELDRVQSGRAIEARQRQAVIAIQIYMDNFKRTKLQVGKRQLYIVQTYYTEPRIYRVLGEDGSQTEVLLNHSMMDETAGVNMIINDVTRGKYRITIDETPLSASFQNAQFEEALMLLEKMGNVLPAPLIADILVDLSTLPRKEEIKQRIQLAMPVMPPGPGAPMPGGGPATGNAPALDQTKSPGGKVLQLRR
jgi:Phage P22-like portal protein